MKARLKLAQPLYISNTVKISRLWAHLHYMHPYSIGMYSTGVESYPDDHYQIYSSLVYWYSHVMFVWKSSRQTRHLMVPVFLCRSLQKYGYNLLPLVIKYFRV